MNDDDEFVYLKNLTFTGVPLAKGILHYKDENTLIYTLKEKYSFEVLLVAFVSCEYLKNKSVWDSPNVLVQEVIRCTGNFDGARHFEVNRTGTEMDGYVYFPDISMMSKTLSLITTLEEKYAK